MRSRNAYTHMGCLHFNTARVYTSHIGALHIYVVLFLTIWLQDTVLSAAGTIVQVWAKEHAQGLDFTCMSNMG